jgi:DNA-binding NarL/FixJ family response regulator
VITFAICSPFPALRAGLRALISADPDLTVTAVAATLVGLAQADGEARVVVATPGWVPDGEVLPTDLAVLLVSDDIEEAQALAAQELRAWGVISPDAPAEALQAAVRALAEGLVVLSAELYSRLRERAPAEQLTNAGALGDGEGPYDRLTGRETEVLSYIAQGQTNKQIALALHISEHTVKFHVSSIYSKLGVSNRTEALRRGARFGLVPL